MLPIFHYETFYFFSTSYSSLTHLFLLPQPIGVSDEGALQVGFEHPEQALDLVTEACANLALPLGSDLHLAINCAAHGLMDYVSDWRTEKGNY